MVGRRTDAANGNSGFSSKGVAANNNNIIFDVGTFYEIIIARDDNNYQSDARANNITKSLNVYATGNTAQTIKWVAIVKTTEVSQ